MLTAYLLTVDGARRSLAAGATLIAIRRDQMDLGPNQPVVVCRRNSWWLAAERFPVLKIESRVEVQLESGGIVRRLGTFDESWIAGGTIMSGLQPADLIVEFDAPGGVWKCPNHDTIWETIVFAEA